jgi:phenylalanyl-tRNA synthetase alpha subunit
MLYRLAQETKVNGVLSTIDAIHLPKLRQVERVIIDKNLVSGGLIGSMDVFFEKMNVLNIKFIHKTKREVFSL